MFTLSTECRYTTDARRRDRVTVQVGYTRNTYRSTAVYLNKATRTRVFSWYHTTLPDGISIANTPQLLQQQPYDDNQSMC